MNAVIEVLYLRRPRLEYVSPPACEFDFSSSGGPVIVLDALGRILAPSGFVLGGRGRFTLSWNNYPGALCYTVYKAVDSNDPFGEYVVVAECIEDPMIDLEPEGPGCYRVSAITENGESELSDPICDVGNCPFILSGATPSMLTVNAGDTITLSCTIGNASTATTYQWFKDGTLISDTSGSTKEVYEKTNAVVGDSGSYTLVVSNSICADESNPAIVTVNAGPPCQEDIDTVGLPPLDLSSASGLSSNGVVVGVFSDPPTSQRPWYHQSGTSQDTRTSVDSAPITAGQSGTTVTASDNFFSASDVGKVIAFSTSELAQITAFISPLQVTVTPSQSVVATTFTLRGNTLGGPFGQAELANANGVIVGLEDVFNSPFSSHLFWLDRDTNDIRDLGASRAANALSDDGFLLLTDNSGFPSVAYLYNPNDQTFLNLGNIGGGAFGVEMNDAHSSIALNCDDPLSFGNNHACRWVSGVVTDIHPAAAGASQSSFAVDINTSGHIVGTYTESASPFKELTFINTGGLSTDIGGFGGDVSGTAINDAGVIVGSAETGLSTSIFRAFIRPSGGPITFIPQLPATTTGVARAINSDGWAVGTMNNVAFIYRNGVVERLFDLIPGGTLWTSLRDAFFINDAGQIVGHGIYNGNVAWFVLQLCS